MSRDGIRLAAILTLLAVTVSACAPVTAPGGRDGADGPRAAGPKRVVAAIMGDPHTLYQQLNPASRVRGIDTLEEMVNSGLTQLDDKGVLRAQLAEQVPSIENGLWRLLPDGRMETTWRVREGARWHDGTPFTSEDLAFTLKVVQDRDFPIFADRAYELIEALEAPDSRTVMVRWKQPFIEADSLFSTTRGMPIARHVLERPYVEERTTFTEHPYWSREFVGTGPYKLRDWVLGSHLVFAANPDYVLGRPKIDEVEVRFILDNNTLAANLLSGAVELTLGRTISGEQAVSIQEQWRDGRMELSYENWIVLYPQFLNANPPELADVRLRRALMHAIDRQQIVDVLQPGLTVVAHSWLNPNQPEYREIDERNVVRYEFDPRRATGLIESMGYTRGPDGMYRSAANQPLNVELRTTAEDDLREKMVFAIVDFWQKVGVGSDPVIIPRQRAADLEYRATFPALELVRLPNDVRGTRSLGSRNTPLPENNFRITGNRSRYLNPEFDALLDRYFVTIPKQERIVIMGQIVHHISDQLVAMGILYNSSPTLMSKRLRNLTAGATGATQAWNANEWDAV